MVAIIETENGYDFIKEQYYKEIEAFKPTYYAWGETVAELFMEVLYSPFLGYLNIITWFLIGYFRNSKTKMVFEILMAWENEFVKILTLFPEIHAPVLSHFITLKHYS